MPNKLFRGYFAYAIVVAIAACLSACKPPPVELTPGRFEVIEPARDRAAVDGLWLIKTGEATSTDGHLHEGGTKDPETIPILCALIRHGDDIVLIDTGLNHHFAFRPQEYLGGLLKFVAERGYELPKMAEGQDVIAQLARMAITPDMVRHIVLTHTHFDHTGELRAFPNAKVWVGKGEKEYLERAFGVSRGVMRKDFEGVRVRELDFTKSPKILTFSGSRDLLGDGSVLVIPTPGHTPGSISVLVKTKAGDVLLVGDAAYSMTNIEKPVLIGLATSREQAADTLTRLHDLRRARPELRIVPFHEPAIWPVGRMEPLPLHEAADPQKSGDSDS